MDHLKSLPSFSVPFYPLSKFWGKIGRLSWPMTRWRFQVHKPSHSGAKQMRCNQRSLWLCEDPVPHSRQREMSLSKCLAPSIALRLQEMTHLYIFQKERASLGGRSEFFFFFFRSEFLKNPSSFKTKSLIYYGLKGCLEGVTSSFRK